ncbi:thioredoxin family protein [Candidatus Parcubacteria bacterium]|nr:thioredoxin family protein [Candidatus Parcubacteria bacterium]
MKNINKNLIPLVVIVVALAIGAVAYSNPSLFTKKQGSQQDNQQDNQNVLSTQEAGEQIIKYINENLLQGQATASLLETPIEENGVYKINFEVEGQKYNFYSTKDAKYLFPQIIDLAKEAEQKALETIGNFSASKDDVCQENGKPIVYFFGSQGCPHCIWEHPLIESVALKFKENIVFHNNMDSQEDMDIFSKYSTGGVPALVIGCKYHRTGSGQNLGEEQESKVLTALICKLTGNQPSDICNEVQELINQI